MQPAVFWLREYNSASGVNLAPIEAMRRPFLLLLLTFSTGLNSLLCHIASAEEENDQENPYLVTNSVSSIEQDQFFRRAVHLYQAAVLGPRPLMPKTQLGQHLFVHLMVHGFGLASQRIMVEGSASIPQLSVLSEHGPIGYIVGMAAGGLFGYLLLRHPKMEDVVAHLEKGQQKGFFIDRAQYAELAAQMPGEECETALRVLIKD